MTATVRAVINDAVARAGCGDRNLYGLVTDTILTALAEAGLAVVPAKPVGTEYACRRTAKWGGTITCPMWKAEALEFAERAGPDTVECVVRRGTYVGPWEPVPDGG